MSAEIVEEMAQHCLPSRARIQAPQFSLLVPIARLGPIRRADIGRINQQNRSTLTRNMRIMLRAGWIEEVPDRNGRGRLVQVSERGRHLLAEAAPARRDAQMRATALLGPAGGAVAEIGTRLLSGAPA